EGLGLVERLDRLLIVAAEERPLALVHEAAEFARQLAFLDGVAEAPFRRLLAPAGVLVVRLYQQRGRVFPDRLGVVLRGHQGLGGVHVFLVVPVLLLVGLCRQGLVRLVEAELGGLVAALEVEGLLEEVGGDGVLLQGQLLLALVQVLLVQLLLVLLLGLDDLVRRRALVLVRRRALVLVGRLVLVFILILFVALLVVRRLLGLLRRLGCLFLGRGIVRPAKVDDGDDTGADEQDDNDQDGQQRDQQAPVRARAGWRHDG